MPRPKSPDPASHTIPVRFTTAELRALDGLRREGETRSAAIRRIFDRVAYAEAVARAHATGIAPPENDPRREVAAGSTGIAFQPGLADYGSTQIAVIDHATGTLLHSAIGPSGRMRAATAIVRALARKDLAGAMSAAQPLVDALTKTFPAVAPVLRTLTGGPAPPIVDALADLAEATIAAEMHALGERPAP